jgi:hypothetical protein
LWILKVCMRLPWMLRLWILPVQIWHSAGVIGLDWTCFISLRLHYLPTDSLESNWFLKPLKAYDLPTGMFTPTDWHIIHNQLGYHLHLKMSWLIILRAAGRVEGQRCHTWRRASAAQRPKAASTCAQVVSSISISWFNQQSIWWISVNLAALKKLVSLHTGIFQCATRN